MGVLDAFLSTWSHARATFGEGVPQDGAQFDNSAQFRQLQGNVESAVPGTNWTGSSSDAYADANSRHGRTLGAMAGLDKRLGAEVDRSAAVVAAGRRDLDAVKQWVVDAASTVPRTAAGERMLWPVVSKGAGEIAHIVQRSHGDLSVVAERLRGIGAEYQALGGDLGEGAAGDQPMNVVGEKQSGGGDEPDAVLDLNDIERRNPGQLGPDGYMELVPGSGVWVPDPRSPTYQPHPPKAPLDLNDIVQQDPKALGQPGQMELVPDSGVWVPDPSSPTYQPHPPKAPLDLNDIVQQDPKALGQPGQMELVPGSGVWVPDPNYRPSW